MVILSPESRSGAPERDEWAEGPPTKCLVAQKQPSRIVILSPESRSGAPERDEWAEGPRTEC